MHERIHPQVGARSKTKGPAKQTGHFRFFVTGNAFTRRHLTKSQLAFVALDVEKIYADEAKNRQGERNDLKQNNIVEKVPQCLNVSPRARVRLKFAPQYCGANRTLSRPRPGEPHYEEGPAVAGHLKTSLFFTS